MERFISVRGIQTNNLKNIDIKIEKNAINLIVGPSGSGKSSLAYDTIAQIGMHELSAMYSDGVNEPEYKVQSFSHMLVTIPVQQMNANNNVRSTIGTYFSLNSFLAKIFSCVLGLPYDYFVLNKTENVCPECLGIGYKKALDCNKIIDYDKRICDVPIKCWKKNKDFYKQILQLFCAGCGIDATKKFKQLSEKQRNEILYGTSVQKYKIKYRNTDHFSTRTTQYYGPMTKVGMLKSFSPSDDFFSEVKCKECLGEKFELGHKEHKVCGLSIGEVMILPFSELLDWAKQVKSKYAPLGIEFSITQLEVFSQKACELNLGYLFINRNIPSLSGGELQRLRLIQIFTSQLADLLIVLDEPLAGLSQQEKTVVYDNVVSLAKKHTLLVVDHHEAFLNVAKRIYALGPGGGKNGGELIDVSKYIKSQRIAYASEAKEVDNIFDINISSEVYGYSGVSIKIAEKRLNVISGHSGVGKTTLLREYLPQYFDNYLYIDQKPMGGNIRSTVATDLNISNRIMQVWAKEFKKDKSFFSNISCGEGACKTCTGTGQITIGSQMQAQLFLKCKDCSGTGFDKKLSNYRIAGMCLQDIWHMTIDEAIIYFESIDDKIVEKLLDAQKLLLGHLEIGEKTSELSGGENIRLKIVKAITSDRIVIGIDEPFKGLNQEEIYMVVQSLNSLATQGKTIIVVDHEESSYKYFSRHIELVDKNGILCEQ